MAKRETAEVIVAIPMLSEQNKLSVTSQLFDAYLACPTKCYLQFKGEVGAGSDYTHAIALAALPTLNVLTQDLTPHMRAHACDPAHWTPHTVRLA